VVCVFFVFFLFFLRQEDSTQGVQLGGVATVCVVNGGLASLFNFVF